jgi:hypothetical protein
MYQPKHVAVTFMYFYTDIYQGHADMISRFYIDLWQEVSRLEEVLHKNAVSYLFYSISTVNTLSTELLKGLETSKKRTSNSHSKSCRGPSASSKQRNGNTGCY